MVHHGAVGSRERRAPRATPVERGTGLRNRSIPGGVGRAWHRLGGPVGGHGDGWRGPGGALRRTDDGVEELDVLPACSRTGAVRLGDLPEDAVAPVVRLRGFMSDMEGAREAFERAVDLLRQELWAVAARVAPGVAPVGWSRPCSPAR